MEEVSLELKLHKRYSKLYPEFSKDSKTTSKIVAREMASILEDVISPDALKPYQKFINHKRNKHANVFCINFIEIGKT